VRRERASAREAPSRTARGKNSCILRPGKQSRKLDAVREEGGKGSKKIKRSRGASAVQKGKKCSLERRP